jgi:hypothetical protein
MCGLYVQDQRHSQTQATPGFHQHVGREAPRGLKGENGTHGPGIPLTIFRLIRGHMWRDILEMVYLDVGEKLDDPGHYEYADKSCEDRPIVHAGTRF